MSEEVEQSEAVEVIAESATVENESSTQENDAIESETVEETVPLYRLKKETRKYRETERSLKDSNKKLAALEAQLELQSKQQLKEPSLSDEDVDYDEDKLKAKTSAYNKQEMINLLDERENVKKNAKQKQENDDLMTSLDDEVNS